ncbi:tRNA (guanine37-N1)-methyltransferase [Arcanobacterium wilhelmae]|uniref:tRNA (guanine-N(1)-)-methyltransferase n=1 Tax=Arcanobacterium wilhelmae TaxID=1803177 RepID=A0ABT9NAU6_9ACTO|nr:tRNA (guanosine(37)-N1)-methyltransferase TrmD [Arcanobacterium wilhelmae]MDP9800331.1 tRNA (guanine37-N1)-methyltransferase [Arcanobacterium wilhelmae]WFN89767.1 tRNA (guanosine(37)-N1)-methyltransferase TrmD [Arcanobacterium wilhelmae]
MKFSILSVFPEFFGVLDLSLVGKARERGIIELESADLRDWTEDVHRTVDDTPAGGGAGMVMKPDVWKKAIDDVVGPAPAGARVVLAIPTPSGMPLTQATLEDLAGADQIVIACGRYEGIDSRVAEYYRGTLEVREYSLGDYVLNGGEVAAVALVEGVSRLLPGMVGNPQSLVEESHGAAGLLEYPVYTRPVDFEGLEIPPVLMSGNHGAVARWRRDRALEKTAARRPDMVAALDAAALDKKDRRMLAELGWLVGKESAHPVPMRIGTATPAQFAALAAETFPDACPSYLSDEAIAEFIDGNLSEAAFAQLAADPQAWLLALWAGEELIGYSLVLQPVADAVVHEDEGAPVDFVAQGGERHGGMAYLSKFYLTRSWRGSGAAAALMDATLASASAQAQGENPYIWLGTNAKNKRAIQAYKKFGFEIAGKRTFIVGGQPNDDYVLARALNLA